jgi:hypothetical protein
MVTRSPSSARRINSVSRFFASAVLTSISEIIARIYGQNKPHPRLGLQTRNHLRAAWGN